MFFKEQKIIKLTLKRRLNLKNKCNNAYLLILIEYVYVHVHSGISYCCDLLLNKQMKVVEALEKYVYILIYIIFKW